MRMPKVHGVIHRRLLVNFRIDAEVMQRALPAPFRPKLYGGYAVAGICLIRLEDIRPRGFPRLLGVSSENAAHRVAVVWDSEEETREGVFIPRRDSGSLLNYVAGGRVFPGEHHRARFNVSDDGNHVDLEMESADRKVRVEVRGTTASALPTSSVFPRLDEASNFFKAGSLGYSAKREGHSLDGITLHTPTWSVAPFEIEHVYSSYFSNPEWFPPGSVKFDCALVMRDVLHEWRAADEMYVDRAG